MAEKKNGEYGNQSITSLKGADRVRKRPAVIFGSDGLEGCEHSFFEILSNSPAAVLLAHCHPRGLAAPSQSDIRTTEKFSDMLSGFDVKLCDHIIFARDDVFCMSRMKNRIRPGIFAFTE